VAVREAPATGRRRPGTVERVLLVATAAVLVFDAIVHLRDAHLYGTGPPGELSKGTLFSLEAVVALLVAAVLVLRPRPVTWALAVLVAGSAATAVLLSRYVDIGAIGPVPDLYEPSWGVPGKLPSAVAELVGTGLALTGLAVSIRNRRSPR
jgi:hypothetical protein